ncbi:MAG: cytochrome C oxidase subunit IV family protein [Anaerolineae bacterium]
MEDARPSRRPYVAVFVILAILTAVEVWVGSIAMAKPLQIGVLLALAAGKAVLVALFYMHLRYDQRVIVLIAASPLLLMSILLIALLPAVSYGR